MTSRYRIGNAQTIGCRETQSNYFSTAYNDVGDLFAVLADGAIDHPNGRRAAIIAVECCVKAFEVSNMQTDQCLYEIALKANGNVQDAIIGKSPRLSLTLGFFTGKHLLYFNVGVNKIYLYNGYSERVLCDDANHPYSCGRYELSPKNNVGFFSVGAYADAHPMERIKIIESEKKTFDKAQCIIESIKEKGIKNQTNATVLLVEVV